MFKYIILFVFLLSSWLHIAQASGIDTLDFVISTFHGVPSSPSPDYDRILENTKHVNLTHIETAFVSPAGNVRALTIADRIGLKVIVQDFSRFGGFQNSDAHIAQTTIESVKQAIEIYGSHPSLAGYYVWDEPFLEQIPQVKKDMDLIRKYAPDKLPHIATLQSYSPDYTWENGRYERYIDDFLRHVRPPLLCTNYYVFAQDISRGISLYESNIWKDWGFIRKKAIEYDIPFWFYIQLMGDILNNKVGDITVNQVAVQNYMALAFGVKGISYYNTIHGIFDEKGNPNHLFDGISILNRETLLIGNKLLNASSEKIYHTGNILHDDYLDKISDSDILKSVSTGLLIGEFIEKKSGEKLLLLVNTDYENTNSGTVSLLGTFSIEKMNRITGDAVTISDKIDSIVYNIPPGRGELFILR